MTSLPNLHNFQYTAYKMDGLSQLLQLSQEWYLENVNLVTSYSSKSVHVTDLFGNIPSEEIIAVCIEVFKKLIAESKELGDPVKIALTFPLICLDNKITFKVPKTIQEVQADLSDEPPSVYLQSWLESKQYARFEEYRVPVEISIPIKDKSQISIIYREFRYEPLLTHDWEFGRDIFIEYYPEGICKP